MLSEAVKASSHILEPRLNQVPKELQRYSQWVVWKAEERKKADGTVKISKIPYDPKTGKKASIRRPEDWGTFDQVCEAYFDVLEYAGIGFVFTEHDPFVGIDLDNCYGDAGELREDAQRAIKELQSFTEKSPSGNGLHVICKGKLPGRGFCDNKAGREMYCEGRFFTVTADTVGGYSTVEECGSALEKLHQDWFGKPISDDRSQSLGDLKWNFEAPLVSLDDMKIGDSWKALVRDGEGLERYTNSAGSPDRSAALFEVCHEMVSVGENVESILTVLTDNTNFLSGAALERRGNNIPSAMDWLWKYTLSAVLNDRQNIINLFDDVRFAESAKQAPAKTEKYGIKFTPANELIHDIKPIEWLIPSYIESNTITMVFGEPGVGKSFMAADLACRVAAGMPWRGIPIKKGTVFYINGEGQCGFSRRIRGWFLRHKVDPAGLMVGKQAIPMTDNAAVEELVEVIKAMAEEHGIPSLVVIDTLARNIGGADENSTVDMKGFIDALDYIKTTFGCVVMVVHHPGISDKTRYRGASVLKGAIDAEYRLIAEPGGMTRLHNNHKMKDAPEPPDVRFRLETQSLENETDDTTAVVVWDDEFADLRDDEPEPPMTKQQKKIWEILGQAMNDITGDVLDNRALVELCIGDGINRGRVTEALKHFEGQGLITVDRTKRPLLIRFKDRIFD